MVSVIGTSAICTSERGEPEDVGDGPGVAVEGAGDEEETAFLVLGSGSHYCFGR